MSQVSRDSALTCKAIRSNKTDMVKRIHKHCETIRVQEGGGVVEGPMVLVVYFEFHASEFRFWPSLLRKSVEDLVGYVFQFTA